MSVEIHRGLAGVVADETAISRVNPLTNSLLYRGYPVQELAAEKTFEEVAYLLWHGELPTPSQLREFCAAERRLRRLDESTLRVLAALPVDAHPMDFVRTALSQIATLDTTLKDTESWARPADDMRRALWLYAVLPTVVAWVQRRRNGLQAVEPRADLDYANNFLWMSFGRLPTAAELDVFRVSLVLYAEHSFNASTFTARVIASTTADLFAAVVGAVGALKGPLHGGANEAVMRVFTEIGSADRVDEWLDEALANKRKIMGFGHRVYKNGDSRVPTMKAALDVLLAGAVASGGDRGQQAERLGELYRELEAGFVARKGIYPNLDYPSGPAYHLLGFDTEIFTPLFVAARVTGWCAHVMEQHSKNVLIRPLSAYSGPAERHFS